jgi:hypothetical protein
MVINPPSMPVDVPSTPQFSEDLEEMCAQVKELYDQLLAEVTV